MYIEGPVGFFRSTEICKKIIIKIGLLGAVVCRLFEHLAEKKIHALFVIDAYRIIPYKTLDKLKKNYIFELSCRFTFF